MLDGRKVAILATDGFEHSELVEPQKALTEAGAQVIVVSLAEGEIQGVKGHDWNGRVAVDTTVDAIQSTDFDALVLPGGVYNPDALRQNDRAVALVRAMMADKKPIAAICHGPWLLAEAGVVKGRKLTSYPSIKTDLINAGADWVDEEVVVDLGLVTSRSPADLPAFCAKTVEEMGEGKHLRRGSSHAAQA